MGTSPPRPIFLRGRESLMRRGIARALQNGGRVARCVVGQVRGEVIFLSCVAQRLVEGRISMRMGMVMGLIVAAALNAEAKDAPAYEKGVLIQMDSSACGYAEKDGKTIAGQIFGTDGQHKNTKQLLCQEYVLQTDRVTYRIQPKDDKHPVLLPVGETAQFRIHKDKMLIRVPEADGKEREYIVLSMTPRTDVAAANRPATAAAAGTR